MKILHLCDSLNPAGLGGYESYLHYLSEHLHNRGDKSVIVAQAQRKDSPSFIDRDYYEIHFLQGNYLEARKWEFFALPETERENRVRDIFKENDLEENIDTLASQLSKLVQELKPDVIHAHSPYVVFNRVLAKLQEEGMFDEIPLIATIHGRPKPLILPNGERTTDIESFTDVCPFDLILAVSENVAAVLDEYLAKKDSAVPILPLYLGIDLTVFHPIPGVEKKWDVAFMGRLEEMKAVDLFPEMLAQLKRNYPNLKMVMTGEGALKEKLLSDFDKAEVSHMINYLGVVEIKEVPKLINQSRIFIYPSREEPFGLSILEAMACGIPVVTTNVYGPKEIVTEGVDGLTVDPDNVSALVKAISTLLDDSQLREEIGMNGKLMVEKRFDINQHMESLVSIYQDLL